jgi:hypothetical protein
MSYMDAWKYIIDNWHVTEWIPIPQNIKDVLKLDSRVGLCSGMLVTRNASLGLSDFINRMNRKRI